MDGRDQSTGAGPSQPLPSDDRNAGPEISVPVSVHPAMAYRPPPQGPDDHVHGVSTNDPKKRPANPVVVCGRLVIIALCLTSMIIQVLRPIYESNLAGQLSMTIILLVWSAIVLLHHILYRHRRKTPPPMYSLQLPETSLICCGEKIHLCGKPEDENDPPKRKYRLPPVELLEIFSAFLLFYFSRKLLSWNWYSRRTRDVFGLTCGIVATVLLTAIFRRLKIACSVQWAPDDENPYDYQIQLPPDDRTIRAGNHPGVAPA